MYAVKKTVRFDRNQPHVLKYSADDKSKHTGVEVSSKCVIFWLCVAQCIPHILFFCAHKNTTQLHHDKCDVTANIMLSRSNEYTGGGWVTWGRVIFIYCVLSNFNYNIATSLFFLMYTPSIHPHRTYFCDVNETVRLEYGEFLLHPGHLVHSGVDIHSGHRYLMIIFAHVE